MCKLLFDKTTKSDLRVCALDCIRSMQSHIITATNGAGAMDSGKVWLWCDDPSQQEEIRRLTAQCL